MTMCAVLLLLVRVGVAAAAALTACRRLLMMGVASVELFNNLGLACFYAQQVHLSAHTLPQYQCMATDAMHPPPAPGLRLPRTLCLSPPPRSAVRYGAELL